jgi:hypothetical protein
VTTALQFRLLARKQAMEDLKMPSGGELSVEDRLALEVRASFILAQELADAAGCISHGYARLTPTRPYMPKEQRRRRDVR